MFKEKLIPREIQFGKSSVQSGDAELFANQGKFYFHIFSFKILHRN